MTKQKKVLNISEGGSHLVISATVAPVRKRLLEKCGDFPSVLCFIRNFYIEGINTMCYTDMVSWIESSRA